MQTPKNLGNTYSATLVTEVLSAVTTQAMPPLLLPLSACATLVPVDDFGPLRAIEVQNVTAISALKTNPTDFEASLDSTVAAVKIQAAQLCRGAYITGMESAAGLRVQRLMEALVRAFSKDILDAVVSQFTVANGFATVATVSPAAFGIDEIRAGIAAVASPRRALLLRSDCFARLIPDKLIPAGGWQLPGFPGGVFEVDLSAAGASLAGVVCDPAALLAAFGPPASVNVQTLSQKTVALPTLGVSIYASSWLKLASRAAHVSLDGMVGASPARTESAALIFAN